jgi:hypothetical protein
MAALLQLAPVQGILNAADTVGWLHHADASTLSEAVQRPLALVCQRAPHAAVPACHRYAALAAIPVPPH